MNEQKFTDLLGHIDPALIARAEESVPMRKKPSFRITLVAVIAALLALSLLLGAAAIAFIPKTYDLDYEIPKQENASKVTQIYYLSENGKIKRQSVLLPPTEQNVFMTWKHLNGLGDEVQLLDVTYNDAANWSGSYITVQLSTALREHSDSEALLDSLQKTLARSFGVMKQNVSFIFNDTVESPLQFYYDLPDAFVGTGGKIDITVGMRNVTDNQNIVFTGAWTDFVPKAKLRADSTIYVEQLILPLPNDSTTEIAEYCLAPGESREVTYTFDIPENAELGYYDLILSFGDAKMTFEGAVEVVVFTVIGNEYLQFAEFLNNYGFTSASSTKFRWALENFKYDGDNVFARMNQGDAEWMPGYSGDIWDGDFCRYQSTTFDSGYTTHVQKSTFTATTLPDGVKLPARIYPDDSLTDALAKLGFSNVQEIVEQRQNSVLISTETAYLCLRFEKGYASIDYCDTIQDGDTAVVRQMHLKYDLATGKFYYLYICAASSNYALPITIIRTNQGQSVNWELSDEQSLRLLEAVNTGAWELDTPIYTDFTLSMMFSFNGDSMLFEESWLLDTNCYMEISSLFIEELLAGFSLYQGEVAFDFPVSDDALAYVELDEQHTQAVLNMLNCGKWLQGVPEIVSTMYCQVGDQDLKYDPDLGIFIENDRVLFLSAEEKQIIDAILDPYM
ncbi:MAG: hypothetical protein IIX86_04100 [Clostridia bacterium]|nr:hypothetical protein [Clostridia bacterium]